VVAFVPERPLCLWDVTTTPDLLWSVEPPFDVKGAVLADRAIIVHNDWSVAALDEKDGRLMWRHEAPGTPGELDSATPIRGLAAASGRVAYIRGSRLVMLDGQSGDIIASRAVPGAVIGWGRDEAYFAVLAASWGSPDMLYVFDLSDGEVRLIAPVGAAHDWNARIEVNRGRVFAACPNIGLVECVEVPSGRVLWRSQGKLQCDRLLQWGLAGDRFFCAGIKGQSGCAVLFDAANGAVIGTYSPEGAVGISDTAFYVCGSGPRVFRYGRSGETLLNAGADFNAPSYRPVAWREAGDRVCVLLGDVDVRSTKPLSLAAYDLSTGAKRGQWDLPTACDRRSQPAMNVIAGDSLAVATGEGFLKVGLPFDAPGADVPIYRFGKAPARAVCFGEASRPEFEARPVASIVVDGDLADWPDALWNDAANDPDAPARVAVGFSDSAFLIAVRTARQHEPAQTRRGAPGADILRVSIDSKNASTRRAGIVDVDVLMVADTASIFSPAADGVTVCRRPNPFGGVDYEIAVDWRTLGRTADHVAASPFMGVSVAGLAPAGVRPWNWPARYVYLPEYFGIVRLSKRER